MNQSERRPVIPWPQSFHLISAGTALQFIGFIIAASSPDMISARIAFGSSVIALTATIGSMFIFVKEIKEKS